MCIFFANHLFFFMWFEVTISMLNYSQSQHPSLAKLVNGNHTNS